MRQVICRTNGCENQDIGIIIPDDGTTVICGVCSNTITEETPLD